MDRCIVKNIRDECHDAHGEQDYCSVTATNEDGRIIGYINYSMYEGVAHVDMIEVHKECKRRGIATQLLNNLKENHEKIEYSLATSDGVKFLNLPGCVGNVP